MFKVNKKTSEQYYSRPSDVFIVNLKLISHIFLVILLLPLKK